MSSITHYSHIGRALQELRAKRRMSQVQVAAEAGIGRSTLVHLERGEDVQLSSAAKVAKVLGAELGVLAEHPDLAKRRQARLEQDARVRAARELHLKLAVRFALNGSDARQLRRDALRMIDLWERDKICSKFYIDGWREVLSGSSTGIARRLISLDPQWGPAMLQNTPFRITAA
jgi:transcriptional regulator with XRE-family HTH domain